MELDQHNYGFQCSLAQIKNRYQLSGLGREITVKTLYRWISCLALNASTNIRRCTKQILVLKTAVKHERTYFNKYNDALSLHSEYDEENDIMNLRKK